MNTLISVIIPVFNTEKYLRQCLDSIIKQNFGSLEIILVDDGSTDGSGAVIDEYASAYAYIRAIHKENGGAACARNVGIKAAKGDFLMFADSDDYWLSDSLKKVWSQFDSVYNPDLTFLRGVKVYPDTSQKPYTDGFTRDRLHRISKASALHYISSVDKFPASVWLKIIKRSVVTDNGISFDEDSVCEDLLFSERVIFASDTYDYIDVPFYAYRQQRAESVTSLFSEKKLGSMLYAVRAMSDPALCGGNDDFSLETRSFAAYEYVMLLYAYGRTDSKIRKKFAEEIKELRFLLDCKSGSRYTFCRVLLKFTGLSLTSLALKVYMKIREGLV